MKTTIKLLGALTMLGLALNAGAMDLAGKTYIQADVGGSFQDDITSTTTGAKITFDPGFRGNVSFGYHVCEAFAVEFETGVAWNSVDKVGPVKLSSVGASTDFYQVPLLVNGIFTIPTGCPFKPYIGGGIGGVASSVNFETGPVSVDDSDFVFGYQGMAGIKYELNEQMDVGIGYKFLGTSDHDFSTLVGLNDSTFNHSVLASFTFRF